MFSDFFFKKNRAVYETVLKDLLEPEDADSMAPG